MQSIKELIGEPLWDGWRFEDNGSIGGGASGTVYKLIRKTQDGTDETSVVKIINVKAEDIQSVNFEAKLAELKTKLTYAENEINALYSMNNCDNVVHCRNCEIRKKYNSSGNMVEFVYLIHMNYYTCMSNNKISNPKIETIKLGFQIGNALKYIHEQGIIHRDIKPENIFIDENGSFLLGDFGVSKRILENSYSTKIGTDLYMAPEVVFVNRNNPYNRTADIYSLGIVMYTMMNENYLPFQLEKGKYTRSPVEANEERLLNEIPRLEIDSEKLSDIIYKCCRLKSKERYQSADELIADIEKYFPAIVNGIKRNTTQPPIFKEFIPIPDNISIDTKQIVLSSNAKTAKQSMASLEMIKSIKSIGTNESTNFRPKGFFSSYINLSEYSYIMFQVELNDIIGNYGIIGNNGTIELQFKLVDSQKNIIVDDPSKINVKADYSILYKMLCINGEDGTSLPPGNYTACFCVDSTKWHEYNFTIESEKVKTSAVKVSEKDVSRRSRNVLIAELIFLVINCVLFYSVMIPEQIMLGYQPIPGLELAVYTALYGIYNSVSVIILSLLYFLSNIKGYDRHLKKYFIFALVGLSINFAEMAIDTFILYSSKTITSDVGKQIVFNFTFILLAFLVSSVIGVLIGALFSFVIKLLIKLFRTMISWVKND